MSLARAKIDIEVCIKCGACVPECPFEAIAQYDENFVISSSKCEPHCTIDCQQHCMTTCPVDAISIVTR